MNMQRVAQTRKGMTVWADQDGSPLFYVTGMVIDGDGSPRCYHPKNIGLDWNANAYDKSRQKWVGVVVDENGNPIVQGTEDPAPGYWVSPTSLTDRRFTRAGDPRRFIDSERIPYIAFPSALMQSGSQTEVKRLELGVNLGDYAIVYHTRTGKLCGAIFADVGPRYKIGEASIRVAELLGLRSSPKNGGTEMSEIAYVVFPKSYDPWPQTVESIEKKARVLFENWGGLARLKEALNPMMPPSPNGEPVPAFDMPDPNEMRDRSEED